LHAPARVFGGYNFLDYEILLKNMIGEKV